MSKDILLDDMETCIENVKPLDAKDYKYDTIVATLKHHEHIINNLFDYIEHIENELFTVKELFATKDIQEK